MKHLNEEELIEHYYSQSPDESEGAVADHLASCPACAQAFAALRSHLSEVPALEPPARDARYGEQVWQSLRPALPDYEKPKWSWLRPGLWKGLSYAAACGLLVAFAFVAGRQWERRQAQTAIVRPSQQQTQPAPAHPQQRVVVVVLSDHLERSERLLVQLKHADADSEEMISPLRDQARVLLAANRICRQDANKIDDPALAPALDRLDHVLAELANHPGPLSAAQITRLQNELNASGLLFEVRVLRTRIPEHRTAARLNGGSI
ncbi:MAG: hypothetical protein P4K86_07830 [Terracidiphilus sp.]|nr:hypothetical protein [Terracidiphilus sp.]MDR3776264.1 hypothetical protein [Terracidiphilus sp.]